MQGDPERSSTCRHMCPKRPRAFSQSKKSQASGRATNLEFCPGGAKNGVLAVSFLLRPTPSLQRCLHAQDVASSALTALLVALRLLAACLTMFSPTFSDGFVCASTLAT